jgi:hypothetical protein
VGSTGTLTVSGGITGTSAQTLTLNGPGTFNFSSGLTGSQYAGNTTVASGKLLITNSTGSALGTGTFTLAKGATFGGSGKATGLNSFALGNGGSGTAQVQVGNGIDATSSLTLAAMSGTIASTNLNFNLSTTNLTANQLNVGSTALSFDGDDTLTLNLQGASIIPANTSFVLIAGTGGTGTGLGQYSGITVSGPNNEISGLSLVFDVNGSPTNYYEPSYLFLVNNANGTDDIEVEVVPEPSAWALIVSGFGLLMLWQRVRRRNYDK